MNEYLAWILVHAHQDTLESDAASTRVARQAGSGRRLRTQRRRPGWTASPVARVFARPVTAMHTWIAAGEL